MGVLIEASNKTAHQRGAVGFSHVQKSSGSELFTEWSRKWACSGAIQSTRATTTRTTTTIELSGLQFWHRVNVISFLFYDLK